jgi:hypothetical protein
LTAHAGIARTGPSTHPLRTATLKYRIPLSSLLYQNH